MFGALVDRPYGVKNRAVAAAVAEGTKGGRDSRFAGWTPHARPDFWHLAAGGQELRSRSAVNGAIHTAATEHALIGGVDDRLALPGGEIALPEGQRAGGGYRIGDGCGVGHGVKCSENGLGERVQRRG